MLSPGDHVGAYEVLGPLGAGAMGQVYRARDVKLGRMAAIKVLPDSLAQDASRRSRLQHEACALATLSHPNIAAVYGLEDAGGAPALVMELVEGRALQHEIPRKGLPLATALRYAIQIARGLEAANRAGIVHRDLKPSNVMVTPAGVIKLLDFGLAKLAPAPQAASSESAETVGQTAEGAIVGTFAYMSPEQAQGLPVDARSDLFSFGILLYEMLTGERPFRGQNPVETLAAVLREEPKPVSSVAAVPEEMDRLLARCLRKSADRRFQTASDLCVALVELAEESSSGRAIVAVRKPRMLPWVAGATIAICAAAGAWIWTHPRSSAGPQALRQLTFESGMALMPALSSDGRMLAYSTDRSGEGVLDIWVQQMAGGDPHRLTSGVGTASNPEFSPDGTKVLFLTGNSIYEIPALGGQARKLLDNAGPFSISPHGEIAYVQTRTGSLQPIYLAPLDGGPPQQWRKECIADAPPAWSPDGRRLAFLGDCGKGFGLYVVQRQDGPPLQVPFAGGSAAMTGRSSMASRVHWRPAGPGSKEGLIVPMTNGDSLNLFQFTLDGAITPVTQGTGWESSAAVSPDGDVVFTRAEYIPVIWSLPLDGSAQPRKEAAPAGLFGVARDGSKLVFGRMNGLTKGYLVARDIRTQTETVIASHTVFTGGVGSFWTQVSPDASQAVYRLNAKRPLQQCVVPLTGGSARCEESLLRLTLASGWRADGARVVGECDSGAICEMDPRDWSVRLVEPVPEGGELLLYPTYSWDGAWIAFMQRRGEKTAITMARVRTDGTLGPQSSWVRVSPPEILAAARPRFSKDGKLIFYIRNEGGVQHLVRQPVDLSAGKAGAPAVSIAAIQVYPTWFADTINSPASVVDVSADRVFFNAVEIRGNIWGIPAR